MKPLLTTSKNIHYIELGEMRLPIKIKKHRTFRRLIMRYQPKEQSLSLTLPERTSIKQGLHFVNERREWIIRQIGQYSKAHNANSFSFSDGREIPVMGKNIVLKHTGGRGTVSEEDGALLVHGEAEFMARRVEKYLMQKAKNEITKLTEIFCAKLNVKHGNITLRDTTSRWGSCSHEGNLSFSWRLIFAPYEVLSYVVAHEAAHLREHNHSPAFWQLVEQIFPGYEAFEKWLKKNGKLLYLYGS